ncbi:dihydroxy-acid dehydratase [Mameliella sediminis]|uniref:dihydroxy-acid dehydratase n=1 Tax=Mameliella sediminis TaxID=2836866 RepID=UPI001CD565C9|nr:dihydroxy-acid dehydratase [Mameliella sediminis]MCA0953862.1 dihydroxy-acid dehydratase [Mameliella alba]
MSAARLFLCAAGALLLAGCMASSPDSNPDGADARARAGLAAFFAGSGGTRVTPLAKASLAGGDVVVAGPEGYCLDPRTKRSGPERGFAVIASCYIISGGKAGYSVPPMLVTVTVGPRGDSTDLPTPQALAQVAGADLLDGRTRRGQVTAHLSSGGDEMFDGSDPRYWRSAFVQGGRLVGLALYAPRGSALAGDRGATALARVRDTIARLSPTVEASTPTPKPAGGVLGRLFNP